MNLPVLVLYLINFVIIGALPRIFFRKDGRLGLMWWLTALPFFACAGLLVGAAAADLAPWGPSEWAPVREAVGVVISVASIALIFLTLGTHRIPLALWHQDDDAPQHVVTYGAYSRIRHPFYTSFLLAFVGAFAFFPHWGTLALLAYAGVVLNATARREETRLSGSEFGAEYRQYMGATGRFLPRPTARSL
jgi:protein-S-isoprenylcysteine O-methyltransferase Ste14